MNSSTGVFSQDVPLSFGQLILRFFKIAVIAFLVMQIKEYVDAGVFDIPGVLMDSALIAAGVLIVDLVSMSLRPRK
ncbi:MAG TPA: hypothetical protein VN364_12880 [Bellilinea sp.]|nr:hypothetical protein [Bellilinea sp.]